MEEILNVIGIVFLFPFLIFMAILIVKNLPYLLSKHTAYPYLDMLDEHSWSSLFRGYRADLRDFWKRWTHRN